MNDTDVLIQQLTAHAEPVRRLRSPLLRTALWVGLAGATVALLAAVFGLRAGGWAVLASPAAASEWIAGLATGVLAAYAAFQVSVPGRSPHWAWLPLPALALWLAGLGWGCLRQVADAGVAALSFSGHGAECAVMITLVSLPLGALLLMMVRHAGVVRPAPTALLAMLAAAAVSSAAVSLLHNGESALMVLLWHVGMVAVLSLLSLAGSHRLFAWIGYSRRGFGR